ncbi:MAG: acyltransferase [Cyclobacteriaceae bacterium]
MLNFTYGATAPLWSIGVEEQFYLVWPHIINTFSSFIRILIFIIFIYLLVKIGIYMTHPTGGLYALINLTRIDCMAIGGLVSILCSYENNFKKIYFSCFIQVLGLLILILPILLPFFFYASLQNELCAIGASIVIANMALNMHSFIKVKSNLLRFLGKLSYGIYVYHLPIVYIVSYLEFGFESLFITYSTIIIASISVAYLSFTFIERPLIKYKSKYSTVESSGIKNIKKNQ